MKFFVLIFTAIVFSVQKWNIFRRALVGNPDLQKNFIE